MAYDEALAERIRARLEDEPGVVEKRMFGGLAFLVEGNMCVGVHGDELIARIEPEETDAALERDGTRIFDITRRPMRGWILVAPSALEDDTELGAWVEEALAFVRGLPPK
jgi:TfoX/Sxy family transcriptional regulator of competence genes